MPDNGETRLEVAVHRREAVTVVAPAGRLVRENQGQLRALLEQLIRGGDSKIAINLELVPYMDSAGLGCCSLIHKLLTEQTGGAVAVFGASANVERTWRMIRLDLVIPMFAKEAEALAWLRRA
jgi:anti-anti-sigma factor